MVEWGRDNGHWFIQGDGRILRIEYTGACSTTGIEGVKRYLAPAFAKMRPIYPGQSIVFPNGAASVDIYDLSGKKIMNIRKTEGMDEIHSIAHQDGMLLAKFKVE